MALGKTIREFGVKIKLAMDNAGVKKAQKNIEEVGKALREVSLHVAEASAALLELAHIEGEHAHSLERQSSELGINTERLQELQYAAKTTADVTDDELNASLQGLAKTLFDARTGSIEAGKTLLKLGVSINDLNDKSPDQIMAVLADRFKTMPDGIYKTALANEALGSSGAKLIPLLNKGAAGIAALGKEGRAYGAVLSDKMIKQDAEFEMQLRKTFTVLKSVTFLIGHELIKYLNPVVKQFLELIRVNRVFIAQALAGVFKNLGLYLAIVFKVMGKIISVFKTLVNLFGGLERVTKLIAIAFGVFTGLKLISSLGLLLTSFRAIVGVLGVLDIEALAIGAAFIALILVVQDLFSDDSIIKEWIKNFTDKFPNISRVVASVFDVVKQAVLDTIDAFATLWGWIEKIAGGAGKILGSVGGFLSKGLSMVDSLIGPSTATASPGAAAGGGGGQQTVNNSAQINVGIPPGMGAKEATQVVSDGVSNGFTDMLRHTRDMSIGGQAW